MSMEDYAKSLLTEITSPLAKKASIGPDSVRREGGTNLGTDRADAEADLAEAARMTNDAIRRVYKLGFSVDANIMTVHSPEGPVPQLDFATVEREPGVDWSERPSRRS
jgi:hypothetical protein